MSRIKRTKLIAIISLFLAGILFAYISPTLFNFGTSRLETRELIGVVATIAMCILTSIAMFLEYFKIVKKKNLTDQT